MGGVISLTHFTPYLSEGPVTCYMQQTLQCLLDLFIVMITVQIIFISKA